MNTFTAHAAQRTRLSAKSLLERLAPEGEMGLLTWTFRETRGNRPVTRGLKGRLRVDLTMLSMVEPLETCGYKLAVVGLH